jgi:uncharacterized protein (DUF58 family)
VTAWLTTAGRAVAYAVAGLILLAVLTRVMVFAWAGYAIAATLAFAYLGATARGRAVERRQVTIVLEPTANSKGEVAQGARIALKLRVRNCGGGWLPRASVKLPACSGLQWESEAQSLGAVAPGSQTSCVVYARAVRSGRWTLHGVEIASDDWLGWMRVSSWLPQRVRVTVVPRSVASQSRVLAERVEARGALPAGLHRARRAGDGYDVRQLRDYAPGDDLRRIAWNASARRGKLLLRQNEDEVTTSHVIAIDLASSLRAGPDEAVFEATLAVAAAGIAGAERRRDRIGVVSFADQALGALPCRDGTVHYQNMVEHLLVLATATDAGVTESGDADVTERLADHVLLHDRVQFRITNSDTLAPIGERVRVGALERWVQSTHAAEVDAARRRRDAAGFSADLSLVRLASQALGLELAPRTSTWTPTRLTGFRKALEHLPELTRQRATVVLLTDLAGTTEWASLKPSVRGLQARGHKLSLLVPDVPQFVPSTESEVSEEVHRLFSLAESTLRRDVAAQWRKMGVPVRFFGPDDAPQSLWEDACRSASAGQSRAYAAPAAGGCPVD